MPDNHIAAALRAVAQDMKRHASQRTASAVTMPEGAARISEHLSARIDQHVARALQQVARLLEQEARRDE
jgi:hypothetical protein